MMDLCAADYAAIRDSRRWATEVPWGTNSSSQNGKLPTCSAACPSLHPFAAAPWGLGYFGQPAYPVALMAADSVKTIPNARRTA